MITAPAGTGIRRVMLVSSNPRDPRDPYARDFAAWERQLSPGHGNPRRILYAAVYVVIVSCGVGLILLHDPTFGVAVLVIAAVVSVLWFSER